jgi:hypothetical protein
MNIWVLWIVLVIASFALLERYGLDHPGGRFGTLSAFMHRLGAAWPLTLVIWGIVIGGLSVHFWWNWCPDLGSTNG